MKIILVIALVSTMLLGCSAAPTMSLKEKNVAYSEYVQNENLTSKDKIHGFKFSGWRSLSDNYLIITAIFKKDYLIETKGTCSNLNKAYRIKLNRASNLAIYKHGDSISPIGQISPSCFIKAIYPISNDQSKYLVKIGEPVENES